MRKTLELRLYEAVHRYADEHGLTADEFSVQGADGASNVMRWFMNDGHIKFEFLRAEHNTRSDYKKERA